MQPWPADHVERWPLERLVPFARNARTHSGGQIDQIAASMREWGWTNPVLVDEGGTIIAGHGRVEAARKLGLTEAPVMVATGWSEAKKRAYVIADNKLALNAGWNEELLAAELTDLRDLAFDLDLVGFDAGELDKLLGSTGVVEGEDDVPAVPETPVSKAGDLWLLGSHRLLCGDAASAADVARLLAGLVAQLMVTDPPYGVEYDPSWRNDVGAAQTHCTGKVMNDDRADWREAWALFPGDVVYVWHGGLHAGTVADSLLERQLDREHHAVRTGDGSGKDGGLGFAELHGCISSSGAARCRSYEVEPRQRGEQGVACDAPRCCRHTCSDVHAHQLLSAAGGG